MTGNPTEKTIFSVTVQENPSGRRFTVKKASDPAPAPVQEAGKPFLPHLGRDPSYHSGLGLALKKQGRLDEAVAAYRTALALKPDAPGTLANLGVALQALGRLDEAVAAYRRALALKPDLPDILSNLGVALQTLGRLDEAVATHRRALALRPASAQILFNLAAALQAQGHAGEAIATYRGALALKPDYPEALCNLGNALRGQGQPEDAVAAYHRALALKPDFPDALCNLGMALREQGQPEDAIAAYRRALDIRPDHPEAHWNLALALLLQGDFAQGWAEYEWRWRCWKMAPQHRCSARPPWSGDAGNGRTILLHTEQGLGDAIQFVRYVPAVRQRGWRVVLEVPRPLLRLFAAIPDITLVARGDPLPPFDSHCPLLSLPRAFGTTLPTIPAVVPYLNACPEAVARWRARLDGNGASGRAGGERRVGVVWAGNPGHPNDRNRSVPLEALAPVLRLPGVRFHSLQKQMAPADRELLAAMGGSTMSGGIDDLGPDLDDFSDTAAVLGALDLLITVDTAVAHLAGALGRPAWVLLPLCADWRWLRDREDSPWYPTLRLFRQHASGHWPEVIGRLGEALRGGSSSPSPA